MYARSESADAGRSAAPAGRVQQGPTGIDLTSPDNFTEKQSYPIWQAVPKAVGETVDSLILTPELHDCLERGRARAPRS